MSDLTTELRRVVLPGLKAESELVALVPKASMYGMRMPSNPTRPFLKLGTTIATPGPTLAGERIRLPVYIESEGRWDGNALVETAEDHIGRIIFLVKHVLHRRVFPVPSGDAKLRVINDIRRLSDDASRIEANLEFAAKMMA